MSKNDHNIRNWRNIYKTRTGQEELRVTACCTALIAYYVGEYYGRKCISIRARGQDRDGAHKIASACRNISVRQALRVYTTLQTPS